MSSKAWAFGVVAAAALMPWAARAFVRRAAESTGDEAPPTEQALAAGVDTAVSLEDVASRLDACAAGEDAERAGCSGIVYVWTPGMPLSRMGIAEIAHAARGLDLTLDVVQAEALYP